MGGRIPVLSVAVLAASAVCLFSISGVAASSPKRMGKRPHLPAKPTPITGPHDPVIGYQSKVLTLGTTDITVFDYWRLGIKKSLLKKRKHGLVVRPITGNVYTWTLSDPFSTGNYSVVVKAFVKEDNGQMHCGTDAGIYSNFTPNGSNTAILDPETVSVVPPLPTRFQTFISNGKKFTTPPKSVTGTLGFKLTYANQPPIYMMTQQRVTWPTPLSQARETPSLQMP